MGKTIGIGAANDGTTASDGETMPKQKGKLPVTQEAGAGGQPLPAARSAVSEQPKEAKDVAAVPRADDEEEQTSKDEQELLAAIGKKATLIDSYLLIRFSSAEDRSERSKRITAFAASLSTIQALGYYGAMFTRQAVGVLSDDRVLQNSELIKRLGGALAPHYFDALASTQEVETLVSVKFIEYLISKPEEKAIYYLDTIAAQAKEEAKAKEEAAAAAAEAQQQPALRQKAQPI